MCPMTPSQLSQNLVGNSKVVAQWYELAHEVFLCDAYSYVVVKETFLFGY